MRGKLQQADGGTLFDQIGDMPLGSADSFIAGTGRAPDRPIGGENDPLNARRPAQNLDLKNGAKWGLELGCLK